MVPPHLLNFQSFNARHDSCLWYCQRHNPRLNYSSRLGDDSFCFVLGWILLVQPLKIVDKEKATNTTNDRDIDWKSLFLAFGPIIASFLLIVSFGISAAISMGLVVVGFIPIFYAFGRKIPIKNVFLESLDVKLFSKRGSYPLLYTAADNHRHLG